MTEKEIDIVLRFIMAKLPEHQLAELDALLEAGPRDEVALDAAIGDRERRDYLALTPLARNRIRQARRSALGQGGDLASTYADRFPNSDRLNP